MSESIPTDSKPEGTGSQSEAAPSELHPEGHAPHPDPITGEPDAHPVGVGVGALSAGAAGAAVGAFLGPVGMLVGAAVGAVVGGLAGHEVAVAEENEPAVLDDELPAATEGRYATEGEGGTTTSATDDVLPTASSGLITPEPESIFADSGTADTVTGEAPLLTESALPAARAVTADPQPLDVTRSTGTVTPAPQPTEREFGSPIEPGTTMATTADEVSPAMAASSYAPALEGDSSYRTHLDTEGTIRTTAYYRYLGRERVGEPGTDVEDWVAAEKEVLHA